MIPVTYNYTCSCGYYNTQQESLQHGVYLRLIVDIVLLCPDCKKRLYPAVTVSYTPLQSDLAPTEKTQQLTTLFQEWRQGDEQEQRETYQALVDAGVVDLDKEQQ